MTVLERIDGRCILGCTAVIDMFCASIFPRYIYDLIAKVVGWKIPFRGCDFHVGTGGPRFECMLNLHMRNVKCQKNKQTFCREMLLLPVSQVSGLQPTYVPAFQQLERHQSRQNGHGPTCT